ncbi:hypothetical protein AURDEDRAFT_173129 [Auricularia subglabra TFB-10046 SS5]|nr:hypothetical protein AURDEDRAFT_173129 [Auricularia subglabra TFB-10046 SS5]
MTPLTADVARSLVAVPQAAGTGEKDDLVPDGGTFHPGLSDRMSFACCLPADASPHALTKYIRGAVEYRHELEGLDHAPCHTYGQDRTILRATQCSQVIEHASANIEMGIFIDLAPYQPLATPR